MDNYNDRNGLMDVRLFCSRIHDKLYLPENEDFGEALLDVCEENRHVIAWTQENDPDNLWVFDPIFGWKPNNEEPLYEDRIYAIF